MNHCVIYAHSGDCAGEVFPVRGVSAESAYNPYIVVRCGETVIDSGLFHPEITNGPVEDAEHTAMLE